MRNFLSKSDLDSDLQKIHLDIQLMLTEQRAQRVDLARVIQLVRSMVDQVNNTKSVEQFGTEYPEEELEVDVSSSTRGN